MRTNALCLVLLAGSMLNMGCSLIAKPEVRDVRARIDKIDLRGISLVFDVDIYNPYTFAIRSPQFRYGLDIADREFIQSNQATAVDLPARDVGTLVMPAQVNYLGLWQAYQGLASAQEVDYRLHGTVLVEAMGQSFELPVSYASSFPVFRIPSFSVPTVRFDGVSLSSATVVLETNVSNPNVFRLGLDKLNFDVRIGEVQVANIRPTLPDGLAAGGASQLTLTGQITAAKALMQLVAGKSLGQPSLQCTGSVETPYGLIPLE